jgi:GNAT superfamily N-acetyltransferase
LNGSLIAFRADPFPSNNELNQLWRSAWDTDKESDFSAILARSLAHVGAFDEDRLVGFVNVAWDGGIHAFLLDTCVAPEMRRQGIATKLIKTAIEISRARGAEWLHVDFEPHLAPLYRACGFEPTEAGLVRLRRR